MCLRTQMRCRAECPRCSDRRTYCPHNRAFGSEKACSSKRSFHDHGERMRTSSLQLCRTEREELLQRYMCRCEENARTNLPMPSRGMRWEIAQSLAVYIPHARVHLVLSCGVCPISTVKRQIALHDTFCGTFDDECTSCIG